MILAASFLCFLKIGSIDVAEWDEARNGINAFEMYYNGNWIDLYFKGSPDTWNNKPPLFIWMLVGSYHLFGFNEFALRFPSVIAAIVFFVLFFQIIAMYKSKFLAMVCCLMLMSCKAIVGHHVARTGDFDSMFLLMLFSSIFYFLKYIDFKKSFAIIYSFLFLGLAFYTKGTAAFLLLPCYFTYALYKGKLPEIIRDRRFLIGALLFTAIVASWIMLVYCLGNNYRTSHYGTSNAIETLFIADTWNRITGTNNEYESSATYFFTVLDAKMNIWNYIFYAVLAYIFWKLYKRKNRFLQENMLMAVSLVFSSLFTIQILLMQNKHVWYLTPAFPFYFIMICLVLSEIGERFKAIYVLVSLLYVFTISRHFVFLSSQSTSLHDAFKKNAKMLKQSEITIIDQPNQNLLMYIYWNAASVRFIDYNPTSQLKGWVAYDSKRQIDKARERNAISHNDFKLSYFE